MSATLHHPHLNTPISATNQYWQFDKPNERDVLAVSQHYGLSDILARILVNRDIPFEAVPSYLNPTLREYLPNPLHLLHMKQAAQRLATAIMNKEKIAIFGDYDVDGATSSSLIKRFIQSVGHDAVIYIPDRIIEGYGPNTAALLKLREQGTSVCITVDCGTVAFDPLEAAHQAGLDIIVIDHHLGQEVLPAAVAVVNPNRIDETSPHRNLAAVGVSFLLAVAVNTIFKESGYYEGKTPPNLLELLDLVALGTVCDVMTLTGLNRAYVSQGLKIMSQRKNMGLRTLCDVAGLDSEASVYHLGFVLGPRINAGGRVGEAGLGARLLTTQDSFEAHDIAVKLNRYNEERKAIEDIVLTQAQEQVIPYAKSKSMLFAYGTGWHPGVIGIVAGRIKEQHYRPIAVIAIDQDIGKASVRSIPGVDIGKAITTAKQEGLLIAGGGHAMAAGFTVETQKIPALWDYLCEAIREDVEIYGSKKIIHIDCSLTISSITPEFIRSLERLGPYGPGNPEPRVALNNVTIVNMDLVGVDHIRCILKDNKSLKSTSLKAMAFRCANQPLGEFLLRSKGKAITVVGKPRINHWQGRESAEFTIEDAADNIHIQ
ncbi:MAG: single-stranded-DNA-specific exonuclease RecJ [Alphaproteobacteria bacterium]|nr:single-stranded-DNA-specific exonuclease RecJ [Alphaproteobacteria bacterium]